MGFIGSMFGAGPTNQGGAGLRFQAERAPVMAAVNQEQTGQAYDQAQQGLAQQQAFLNALAAQNGIANQSNVYNQLQNIASGAAPSAAQAQLQQATNQNIQNQAAMMASQRGAGANVGLIARQASQQGAGAQQAAAAQAAALRAQEQQGALGQLAGLSTQQVGQQQGALQTYNQAAQSEQQNLLNAVAQLNNANVGMQSNVNSANAGVAQQAAGAQANMFGNMMQGGASALMMLADGGEVKKPIEHHGIGGSIGNQSSMGMLDLGTLKMADGGSVPAGPSSFVGRFMKGFAGSQPSQQPNELPKQSDMTKIDQNSSLAKGSNQMGQALAGLAPMALAALAKGGKVPAMVSPGEIYLPPKKAEEVAKGKANPMKVGQKIPGKAKVPGDSLKNDTVRRELQEGGVVVPRTKAQDPKAATNFVAAVKGRKGKLPAKKS